MVCATVVRMKNAQCGFGETGYAWAGKTALVLLATGKPVPFRQQPDGLYLDLPAQPMGVHAYAYRIGLEGS